MTTFDPALAQNLGYRPVLVHYVLMASTSVSLVAAFESVGSIIVIAMLIVPPATALLLTRRLHTMLLIASITAVASSVLGHLGALYVPSWFGMESTTTSGMIALAAGVLFTLAWLFSPTEGLVFKSRRHQHDGEDILTESAS